MNYILAIDQGTTSTTVLIVDEGLKVCGSASCEFPQIYPNNDWVEHRPDDIWQSVLEAIGTAVARARIDAKHIVAIGITNQRETTAVWDRESGEPVYNAIVWQCRRTTEMCRRLESEGVEPLIRQKTGLLCDPYFSATKIRWILDHTGQHQAAADGKLCFGTVDTYLLYQLTGRRVHATDPSNASRTLLMDLEKLSWDADLLKIFDVPEAILPEIRPNSGLFGRTLGVPGLPDGIPVMSMIGDQQSALFGQCCHSAGDAKCTFGTGAFLLLNTGARIVHSKAGLLSTCAWEIGGERCYALEGSAFVAGALVQWLRDGLGIISSSSEVEALARSVPDDGGVIIVPALTGLGAPHWRPDVRGVISGITRATTRGHIARAALMGICQQNTDLLEAMTADLKTPLNSLKVDGGASANDLLMQLQADLLKVTLVRPKNMQTTAMGAAMCAALGIGMYDSLEALRRAYEIETVFEPLQSEPWHSGVREAWREALKKL